MSARPLLTLLLAFGAVGALSGCGAKQLMSSSSSGSVVGTTPAVATNALQAPVPAAPAPIASAPAGEQPLDTDTRAKTSAPSSSSEPPLLTTSNLKTSKVRTPSDDHLPKWVPVKGRLTVVDSTDLAENLGLVPQGATKKSDERISVADKLAEENAARAKTDPMTQGTSWSYAKAGRVRSRR